MYVYDDVYVFLYILVIMDCLIFFFRNLLVVDEFFKLVKYGDVV